jgi:cold shock CspA family protein/ribosome-associated translation inhibitor RaiA
MTNNGQAANLELSFKGMQPSETIRYKVQENVDKLQARYPDITTWHVHVNGPIGSAGLFEISVEARVPGTELAVGRKPGDRNTHSDALIALRDSFAAMERQLKKRRRQRHGEVKMHEGKPQGQVATLFQDQGYGFVTVSDGPEVYFHQNAVIDSDFKDLSVGDTVELSISYGESARGPQATSVRRISAMRYDPQRD